MVSENFSMNTSCPLFDGQEYRCTTIEVVKDVMASLSLIGCLFIIGIIWLFRKYVVFAQRLILYLAIAAFFESIFYLMTGVYDPGPYCSFSGWSVQFIDFAVMMWVSCITFNLYMNAVKMKSTQHLELAYHAVSWGLPLLVSFIPFINDMYGPAGPLCWIKDNWRWRVAVWYGPLLIFIIIMFVVYIYIIVHINRKINTWEGHHNPDIERHKLMMKEDIKPLMAYPFVYLVLSIFPLINRIQDATSDRSIYWLMVAAILCSPLPGAIFAVVFGIDKTTAERLHPASIKVALMNRYGGTDSIVREYNPEEFQPAEEQMQDTPSILPEHP